MTDWIASPAVTLNTAYGLVRAAFTRSTHVAVSVQAHHNDNLPALTYRGTDYIGMVHLFAGEPGERWAIRDLSDVSLSKRGNYGNNADAPRTHRDALVSALTDAVMAYISDDPDVLRQADYSHAAQLLHSLEQDQVEAQTTLDRIMGKVEAAQRLMDENAPDESL